MKRQINFLTKFSVKSFYLFLALFSMNAHASPVATEATTLNIVLLAVFVFMAVGISFACSLAESTLLSITPSYIADIRETDPKKSELLKRLKQDKVDQSLAGILTLNTIANTAGSIGAGAQAIIVFGNAWFTLFSAVMTFAILTFSEIIPKTLGTVYWRQLSGIVAHFVRGIIILLYPIILISEKLTQLLVRGKDGNEFSRREFTALASVGEESGKINPLESRILRNLFAFGAIKIEDIMTPRSVIFALEKTETIADIFANNAKLNFSRIPIYDTDFDDISGFVLKADLLMAKANDNFHQAIESYNREIHFVFNKMKLLDLLDLMLKERIHIAMVVGEYGEVKGLVSLEDVLETLLGLEIVDEIDRVEDMQELARQLMEKRVKRLNMKLAEDIDEEVEELDKQAELNSAEKDDLKDTNDTLKTE